METCGVLKLSKPLLIDGEEIETIPYNFDHVPSTAMKDATNILVKQGHVMQYFGTDPVYNLIMFAFATDIHPHDIQRLNVKDQHKAVQLSMGFFNSDSEE